MASRILSVSSEAAARVEVEETLHENLYPGTEIMTDVGNVHFKQAGHHTLVPQPSDDPNDPLNWSRMWKTLSMSAMSISSFTLLFSPLSVAPQVPFYMMEFNASLPNVINFIGVTILVLGFSNLIWVPMARICGRRPMLTVATLVTIASNIWRAEAKTYDSFLGACILSGIGSGPGETLGPMISPEILTADRRTIVTDVMFLHERGLYMGIYSWAAWSGVLLGPVVAGVTSQNYGWRSFWWVSTALSCFSLIFQILFLPETKWERRVVHVAHEPVANSSPRQFEKEKPAAHMEERSELSAQQESTNDVVVKLTGRPGKKQFSLFTGFDKSEPFFLSILLPFKLFAFPIVHWGSFVFSWCASCFLVVNITQSQALAGPPWLLTPSQVGYTNFAVFVGVSISLFTAGPLSDWISMRATKKNRGIREPEMRLVTLIPYTSCAVIGSVIMAFGYQRGWSWEVIVVLGYTLVGVQLAAISMISTTYAIDSYKPVAGEFLVSATVNKNLWAYGLTKFMNVWIERDGYIGPIMMNTGLYLLWILLAIPLYFYGKKLRGYTRNSRVHHVARDAM